METTCRGDRRWTVQPGCVGVVGAHIAVPSSIRSRNLEFRLPLTMAARIQFAEIRVVFEGMIEIC